MRWLGRRGSGKVMDRRGSKTAGVLGSGGIIGAVLYFILTGDPSVIVNQIQEGNTPRLPQAVEQSQVEFVRVVLADTEDVWNTVFAASQRRYEEPNLIVFDGHVQSACGTASAAVGPFYCPRDRRVYIDLGFFAAMESSFGARGDFARAYVIAHEVAHHVQNLLGRMPAAQAGNASSVAIELQADCLAGVWAMRTEAEKQVLEPGDIEEAMGAAAAVGDDRLQMRQQGYVVPDSFTHGTSEQRVAAFQRGLKRGDPRDCELEMI